MPTLVVVAVAVLQAQCWADWDRRKCRWAGIDYQLAVDMVTIKYNDQSGLAVHIYLNLPAHWAPDQAPKADQILLVGDCRSQMDYRVQRVHTPVRVLWVV